MKVKDLLSILSTCNPEADIWTWDCYTDSATQDLEVDGFYGDGRSNVINGVMLCSSVITGLPLPLKPIEMKPRMIHGNCGTECVHNGKDWVCPKCVEFPPVMVGAGSCGKEENNK